MTNTPLKLISPVSPSAFIEKHFINGSDQDNCVLRFREGRNVVINGDNQIEPRTRDSCRTSFKPLCEYKWGAKSNYDGQILSSRSNFVAYRIFSESTGEAVRILGREKPVRHLIKDFRKSIVDVKWSSNCSYLAVVDSNSNLYVYALEESDNSAISKYLNIIRDDADASDNKLSWCHYVPPCENSDLHRLVLAIMQSHSLDIFLIDKIKAQAGSQEISFTEAKNTGGVLSLEFDVRLTSLKLSPDATALCVSTADGYISSYIIDEEELRFANRECPLPNSYVDDLFFLDNLCIQTNDPFWKFCMISTDMGRRLAIYDYDNWECLAKLRFNLPNLVNSLVHLTEPTAQFIFVMDYDAANLYCIELDTATRPFFLGCTLVTFAKPIIRMSEPCLLEHSENPRGDFGDFEDDDSTTAHNSIVVRFTTITQRSLFDLSVELERSCSDAQRNLFPAPLSHPTHSNASLDIVIDEAANNGESQKNCHSTNSDAPAPESNGVNCNLNELIEQKFEEMSERFSDQLDNLRKEVKTQQESAVAALSEKLSSELLVHQQYTEEMFKKLNNDLLESIGTSLASSITTQNSMLQQLLESSQTKAIECAKHGANQILIPSIDAICAQLFLQLNDTFSQGLQQFMNQMTSHHQRATPVVSGIPSSVLGASTGPSDQQIILQLLQQNQQGKAIDVALSRHDSSTLMFLFSKVNMDDLFTKAPLMPPSKLLVMLQILSKRIDSDTELKFRYILDILISLNRHYKNCLDEQVVLVLDQLNSAVKAIAATDSKGIFQFQIRTIQQLIQNFVCNF